MGSWLGFGYPGMYYILLQLFDNNILCLKQVIQADMEDHMPLPSPTSAERSSNW